MLETAAVEKGLPQNLEAERSVLGAILLDPASLSFVVPILKEDDFFPDTHRRIYRGMTELFSRSAEIDILTLKEELDRAGTIDKAGGAAYLSTLLDGVPEVANVEHYARIVKEKSTLRRLIRVGQQMVREGLSQEKNAEELLGDSTGSIFDIAEDSVRGGFVPIGQVVKHNLEIIDQAINQAREALVGDPANPNKFYAAITDNNVPYRVYGSQQDNTSVSIASRKPR